MSKCLKLVNTKKTGGSDLDHPRAVNSKGKVILTVCLSVCMWECERESMSVRGCLRAFLSPGEEVYSISFYKLIRVPPSPRVIQWFRLFIC